MTDDNKNTNLKYPREWFSKKYLSIKHHIADFWFVWGLMLLLLLVSLIVPIPKSWVTILELLLFSYIVFKPMGAVYALVGASTSIRAFFINFLLISMAFMGIYYGLFFKNAGICYDGNVPNINYTIFQDYPKEQQIIEVNDTIRTSFYEERIINGTSVTEEVRQTRVEVLTYQRITLGCVCENTLITSLTQDPSDFYYIISDLGENINAVSSDPKKTRLFTYTLLLHILISWLFLGVFISLVYSKFRYEA